MYLYRKQEDKKCWWDRVNNTASGIDLQLNCKHDLIALNSLARNEKVIC